MDLEKIIENSLAPEEVNVLDYSVVEGDDESSDSFDVLVDFEGSINLEEMYNSNHGLQLYGKDGTNVSLKGLRDGDLLLHVDNYKPLI